MITADVHGVDRYLMVATDQLNLVEDDVACQVGNEVVDPWDWLPLVLRGAI